jgi:hypothetical protein
MLFFTLPRTVNHSIDDGWVNGTLKVTVVPFSGADVTSSVPPTSIARSRMNATPSPSAS